VKPTYVGDVLDLEGTVKERLESRQVVVIRFQFVRQGEMVANGQVSVMICHL
jgi:hypothetical protein